MKKWMSLLAVAPLLMAPLSVAQAQPASQTLPNYIINAVAEVTAYDSLPMNANTSIKQGSGVFVDDGGCLYTNSHVVIDIASGQIEPHIGVGIATDRALAPETTYEAKVIFVDQAVDLAYLCPLDKTTPVFTDFFDRIDQPQYTKRAFGEDVWVMGYPDAGEGTISVSPGHIVGFISNPNTKDWQGVVQLDPSLLKLYKADSLAGPGVSGGVMVNSDLQLIGVPFAGTIFPGGFVFALSEDVYQTFEQHLRAYLYQNNLVPLDCVYDASSKYYVQSGQKFYDNQCSQPYDAAMEKEVKTTYFSACSVDISQQHLVAAIKRSKELGDLSKWSDSVTARCGSAPKPAPVVSKPAPTAPLKATAAKKKRGSVSKTTNMSVKTK